MKKILVVDDNAASRELLRVLLEGPERQILEATQGQEALERIAETMPDLVLMDIQMPLMDGFAAVRHLREDPRFTALRVIAVTAYAMRGDRQRALAAGFDDYVTKPLDGAALRKQVGQLLETGSNE